MDLTMNSNALAFWQAHKFASSDNNADGESSSRLSSLRSLFLSLPKLEKKGILKSSTSQYLGQRLAADMEEITRSQLPSDDPEANITRLQINCESRLTFNRTALPEPVVKLLERQEIQRTRGDGLQYSDIWKSKADEENVRLCVVAQAHIKTRPALKRSSFNGSASSVSNNVTTEAKGQTLSNGIGRKNEGIRAAAMDIDDSGSNKRFTDRRLFQGRKNSRFGDAELESVSKKPYRESGGDAEQENNDKGQNPFITAHDQLIINSKSGNNQSCSNAGISATSYGSSSKSLGARRGAAGKFVPPISSKEQDTHSNGQTDGGKLNGSEGKIKGIDDKMIELIQNEIMDHGPPITWDDIAGLEFAKNTIQEIVIWPMLRPDIFKGLRGPPKGLLLFGPPGTGKTLIGKCIASQSRATFFSISASSLTSKWVGEGEKMVRALFAVARCDLPAVIFIDEIDSLLSQRSDGEHESSRRIKTEFLVQLDGATTNSDERLLVVGATNRPQELDEAARRRLVKRLYIPLPDGPARRQIVANLMEEQAATLSDQDLQKIVSRTEGYSGADMSNLCREAALGPIRSMTSQDIRLIKPDDVRDIRIEDFDKALSHVRPSVSASDLQTYINWDRLYGSGGNPAR